MVVSSLRTSPGDNGPENGNVAAAPRSGVNVNKLPTVGMHFNPPPCGVTPGRVSDGCFKKRTTLDTLWRQRW